MMYLSTDRNRGRAVRVRGEGNCYPPFYLLEILRERCKLKKFHYFYAISFLLEEKKTPQARKTSKFIFRFIQSIYIRHLLVIKNGYIIANHITTMRNLATRQIFSTFNSLTL